MSMIAEHVDEVRVRRYGDVPECDVVVAVRGLEMSLRCRDYNQAVKWARIECRSYKIAGGFTVMPKVGKTAHKLDAIRPGGSGPGHRPVAFRAADADFPAGRQLARNLQSGTFVDRRLSR
jgi:hypothetical protein